MQKRKLQQAKHIQRTPMNRRKLTLKGYPENKDARLDKKLKRKKYYI